jgi:hypothetical protein
MTIHCETCLVRRLQANVTHASRTNWSFCLSEQSVTGLLCLLDKDTSVVSFKGEATTKPERASVIMEAIEIIVYVVIDNEL